MFDNSLHYSNDETEHGITESSEAEADTSAHSADMTQSFSPMSLSEDEEFISMEPTLKFQLGCIVECIHQTTEIVLGDKETVLKVRCFVFLTVLCGFTHILSYSHVFYCT